METIVGGCSCQPTVIERGGRAIFIGILRWGMAATRSITPSGGLAGPYICSLEWSFGMVSPPLWVEDESVHPVVIGRSL